MNKFIGGLLVISLLSRTTLLRVDYIAYEIYKSNTKIIAYILNEQKEEDDSSSSVDVEGLIDEIDTNKRQINTLASAKNEIVKKIETRMDLNSYAKTAFNEDQIETFTDFVKTYEEEKTNINQLYAKLYSVDYTKMQNMLLQEDTDFEEIHRELTEMSTIQTALIDSLEKVVSLGEEVLTVV